MSKVSIIVPVYNVEKFLSRCVDSILIQTYQNWELILVDDGSPDSSPEICDEYAQKDSRITVIHQENSGANRAREAGVKASNACDYITFVDSDDTLPPTALQTLHSFTDKKYDIIIGTYDRNPKSYTDGVIDKLELAKRIYHYDIASSPYAKLFRRELFDDNTFDLPRDFVMGEDFIMNLRLAFACKRKIRVIPMVVYHYKDNAEGIMNTFHYTLDYLSKSYYYKKSVIPTKYRKECMPCCIDNVLLSCHIIVGHYSHCHTKVRTALHQEVMEDIRLYNYTAQWWKHFSLRFSSPTFSRFYLWIHGAIVSLKKIKRRLN